MKKSNYSSKMLIWGILLIPICFFAFFMYMEFTPRIPFFADSVKDNRYDYMCNLETLRKLTNTSDFPKFEAKAYEYINDDNEKEIFFRCRFNPTISEDSINSVRARFEGGYVDIYDTGEIDFIKGWTNKQNMKIPDGMKENMLVCISTYLGDNEFIVHYKNNPSSDCLSKDSISHFLEVEIPDYDIINFISPNNYYLKLKTPINDSIRKELRKKKWWEYDKKENKGSVNTDLKNTRNISLVIDFNTNIINIDKY